jgi:hypothetical protein
MDRSGKPLAGYGGFLNECEAWWNAGVACRPIFEELGIPSEGLTKEGKP